MRLFAPFLLGVLCLALLDDGIFVSSQSTSAVSVTLPATTNETASNETAMEDETMMMTEAPTEDTLTGFADPESEAPSLVDAETIAPSEEMTMGESDSVPGVLEELGELLEDVLDDFLATDMPDETSNETLAPTIDDTMAVTMIEVDEGASNATDMDDVAQEQVGNVTLETDATAVPIDIETEAPTIPEVVEVATETPVVTEAPLETEPETVPETEPETVPETSSPTETPATITNVPATATDQITAPPIPPDATECAVQVSNTDPVCAQLLKFTTAVCDCYNFCSGKLIACLEYGERNSFSCSGETVAGCTNDQKVVSASPPRMVASFTAVLAAALPALIFA